MPDYFYLAVVFGLTLALTTLVVGVVVAAAIERYLDRKWAAEVEASVAADEQRAREFYDWQRDLCAQVDFAGTPVFDALHRERFEADARAEIERLTGGAAS